PTLATGPRSRGVPGQALRRRRQGPRALARVPGGRAGRVADPPRRPRPAVPCGAAAGPWLRPLGEPVRAGPAEPPPGLRTLPGPRRCAARAGPALARDDRTALARRRARCLRRAGRAGAGRAV